MLCPYCNAPVERDFQFCGECGAPLASDAPQSGALPEDEFATQVSKPMPAPAPVRTPPPPVYNYEPPQAPPPMATRQPPVTPATPPKRRNCLLGVLVGVFVVACLCVVTVGGYNLLKPRLPFSDFLTPSTGGGAEASVDVVNKLDIPICYVYISQAGSSDWGSDWLGDTDRIDPGGTSTFWVPVGQIVDLRVDDCEGEMLDSQFAVEVTEIGIVYTLDPVP